MLTRACYPQGLYIISSLAQSHTRSLLYTFRGLPAISRNLHRFTLIPLRCFSSFYKTFYRYKNEYTCKSNRIVLRQEKQSTESQIEKVEIHFFLVCCFSSPFLRKADLVVLTCI